MDKLIESLWQGRAGTLKGDFPPVSVDEGQRLQLTLLDRWLSTGEELGGYKVGMTSGTSRDRLGKGIRPFGYVLKSRIIPSGGSVILNDIGLLGLENELVFRVGQDIKSGNATASDARDTIDGVAPGFEIGQTRAPADASNGIRVAENLTQWGIVAGEFVDKDQDYDNLVVIMSCNNEVVQTVAAKGHIDDHFQSIAALINRLYRFGRGLRAGELIITGAYTRQAAQEPGSWCGDFGPIGHARLEVN